MKYEVRRRYGTPLLHTLLEEEKPLNINKVLFPINKSNPPSIMLALACGERIEKLNALRHCIWISCANGQIGD